MPPTPRAQERKARPFGPPRPPEPRVLSLLGLTILAVGLLLAYLLYEIWPSVVHSTGETPKRQNVTLFNGQITFKPATESVLILLVILAGALGAYVHAATSFSKYVGRREFARSWQWWYLLRVPIGSALALILYFALRGGLVGTDATSADLNPYGVAAFAALAGLFSKQAVDKLSEVFDTFFRTRPEDGDAVDLEAPVPELETIDPPAFSAADAQKLKLMGGGFVENSAVLIKPEAAEASNPLRPAEGPVTETEMIVAIGAGELDPGKYLVHVVNPPPGGGVSQALPLRVDTPSPPPPGATVAPVGDQ
jgi:hypothetical protein